MKKVYKIFLLLVLILSLPASIIIMGDEVEDNPFFDVSDSAWYYNPVIYAYTNQYMSGTSSTTFSPEINMTRGMFVRALASMNQADLTIYQESSFEDVDMGIYYGAAIEWAYEGGIVAGTSKTTFSPDAPIKREEICLMLMKYCEFIEYDLSHMPTEGFADDGDISSWAHDAVYVIKSAGFVTGKGEGIFDPRAMATRAEIATMLMRLHIYVKDAATSFTVSNYFDDDMVLQRDETLKIWGSADASQNGKKVRASLCDASGEAIIQNGKWEITFDKTLDTNADMGNTLRVYGQGINIEYYNILIGDVYMVIGQSNIWYSVSKMINDNPSYSQYVTINDNLNVRLHRSTLDDTGVNPWGGSTGNAPPSEKIIHNRGWQKPSAGANDFSAMGYIFGVDLSNTVNVPVGLIQIDASGCPLATFAPGELCAKWNCDRIRNGDGVYWENTTSTKSRFIYNQLINPLMNTTIAGLIWYQGETDSHNTIYHGRANTPYINEFTDLMAYMRENLTSHDFPVYVVELPTMYRPDFIDFGVERAEMGQIPLMVENCYVSSSLSAWNNSSFGENWHPYCKPEQVSRLLPLVLATAYNTGDIESVSGPQAISVEYNGNTAVITYKYTGGGLTTYEDDELNGFRVLSGGKWVTPTNAQITAPDKVTITYSSTIYGVGYGVETAANYPSTLNLCSGTGVPALAIADYKD